MKSIYGTLIGSLLLVAGLKAQNKAPREYFEEMKNAGSFVHTLVDTNGEKHSAPDPGYVCFAENNLTADDAGLFFTFEAMAYDKYWAEAQAVLASDASPEQRQKAMARMDEIQHRQPYVLFLSGQLMSLTPKEAADFFRKGGQELDLNLYMHGVKSWSQALHRYRETDKWVSSNAKMDFSVEPSTLRFLWSSSGDKPLILNGRCEKIDSGTRDTNTQTR